MKKLLLAIAAFGAVLGSTAALAPAAVYASHVCDPGTRRAGQPVPHNTGVRQAETYCNQSVTPREEQVADRQAAERNEVDTDCDAATLNSSNCKIYFWLARFVRALSALAGIAVVIMVVVGGIEYAASKDNPQATAAAKNRIKNAILALVMYIFAFAFLQWIVPGGVV
jgi:hypothetical protein